MTVPSGRRGATLGLTWGTPDARKCYSREQRWDSPTIRHLPDGNDPQLGRVFNSWAPSEKPSPLRQKSSPPLRGIHLARNDCLGRMHSAFQCPNRISGEPGLLAQLLVCGWPPRPFLPPMGPAFFPEKSASRFTAHAQGGDAGGVGARISRAPY
jgi:hypothetical protein